MLDKFFCRVKDEHPKHKALDEAIRLCDKEISFPSEKEAIEYCKENNIDPHKVILKGDRYTVKE